MKLVSSCLVGLCATWRAKDSTREKLEEMLASGQLIPVCPEQMGGLATPRPPAEIVGGDGDAVLDGKAKVMSREGVDVTENFIRGAEEVLKLAQRVRPDEIVMKEKSPSCGVRYIYDGSFRGHLVPGSGVTTALLRRHGFIVVSDEEFLHGIASPPKDDPMAYA